MKQPLSHLRKFDPTKLPELLHSNSRKDFLAALRLVVRAVLASMRVEDHYVQVMNEIKREPGYRELNNNWEKLKPESRGEKWQELMERLVQVAYAGRPYCIRCGECCRHGSPSLHLEDAELLTKGFISTRQVYTLRQGSPVKHNIEGRFDILSEELIKIKEDPESRHCIFYSEYNISCLIYDHRPLQCRSQECWNPTVLQQVWYQKKLNRRHLLQQDQELLSLLQAHDERCDPRKLDAAFQQVHQNGDVAALDQILDMLSQDTGFRAFLINKSVCDEEELDFYLGRPMAESLRAYGMKVEKYKDGVYHLVAAR